MAHQSPAAARRGRRTFDKRLDGSVDIPPDDWCLEGPNGQPLTQKCLFRS
jgi:hypothetical protein